MISHTQVADNFSISNSLLLINFTLIEEPNLYPLDFAPVPWTPQGEAGQPAWMWAMRADSSLTEPQKESSSFWYFFTCPAMAFWIWLWLLLLSGITLISVFHITCAPHARKFVSSGAGTNVRCRTWLQAQSGSAPRCKSACLTLDPKPKNPSAAPEHASALVPVT